MPYAEDLRQLDFPSLTTVTTTNGKILTEHPNLPTPKQQQAMDQFVEDMDLSEAGGKDDDGYAFLPFSLVFPRAARPPARRPEKLTPAYPRRVGTPSPGPTCTTRTTPLTTTFAIPSFTACRTLMVLCPPCPRSWSNTLIRRGRWCTRQEGA